MDHYGRTFNFPENCQNDLPLSFQNESKQHEVDLQYGFLIQNTWIIYACAFCCFASHYIPLTVIPIRI